MDKHKYCCQNTIQNFHDHIIPVSDSLEVNSACLYDISRQDFINGLKELTEVIKSVYTDMIKSPSDYGLPLVDDIEYSPFNPKAADSGNSAHRLIALLNTFARNGELTGSELRVDNKKLTEKLKKLKSIHKVTNSKMIFKKLCDFGFIYDNSVLSYPDNNNVIPALYGYMQNVTLNHEAVFSLNCFLAAQNPPAHQAVFAEYLSGTEQEFYKQLNKFMDNEGFVISNVSGYRSFSFSLEYWIDSKDEKRIARFYSDYGKLIVCLKLHNSGCYDYYTEMLPNNIKQMFRKESSCRFCKEPCKIRLYRTFEGVEYTDCGYGNWFNIPVFDPNDIEYYKQIILLEVKAVKTNARKKGVKVYKD